MINATNEGGQTFEPIEAGTYVARCYSMVHLGTIMENYMGENKLMNKVRISFELPTELKVFKEENGEQPHSISKEFTLSLHEKSNLRKTLEGWSGKAFTDEECKKFDITKLLGVPCMVSIIHKSNKEGKTYATLSGISTLPKGISCPPQINKSFEFSWDEFNEDKFNSLPDWLKEKMRKSMEYQEITTPGHQSLSEEEQEIQPLPF
jgi:hypothetical protein